MGIITIRREALQLLSDTIFRQNNESCNSSNIDEVIRSVYFFYDKISQANKSIKKNTRH